MSQSSTAADAVKAERNRFAAINALPEAKGREKLAMTLAATTDMSVDQAKAALAVAPIATFGARASDSGIGLSIDHGQLQPQNSQNVSAMWDAALTSRGMKLR
ncbi:hypothetical protein CWO91_36915 [Bradyrhizobium genosp. SA-3]|uniref:hypothetical protein n=1 Tax=Bradyrhizobium genosp. SA-3 TaxID=508868 RepID=UPI00102984FA|nr:hypothetical protein [Bradyrhizobium genosp. SA-3]RZM98731.1 hypothetical protein CWO91_36915 [Bradyrhizobium genosp. SA-3]